MLTQPTVSKAPPADPAQDQAGLFAVGLEHVRRLARRVWTDHNVHDPGITTLELLCYALTDLGYRASFPVEDLLARPDGDPSKSPLATARKILPNEPLTANDYRKLLIDLTDPRPNHKNSRPIRNAWIEASPQRLYADPLQRKLHVKDPGTPGVRPIDIQGLYQVRVDFADDPAPSASDAQLILAAARAKLHAHRNLCEDFVAVTAVQKQPFNLCGELVLDPDADPIGIHAEVLFLVEQYLAPPVFTYTLDEMLARTRPDGGRWTVADAFNGPALDHGFIDEEELVAADLRKQVRLSDVISIIMDIKGVRAVRDLVIHPSSQVTPLVAPWTVDVAKGMSPTLRGGTSRLVCYKRDQPFVAEPEKVDRRYDVLVKELKKRLDRVFPAADIAIPAGRHRNVEQYLSFQSHFPAIYGLGESGLPSGADKPREALVLQLKGYLLFFDQLMADYCAQLARVKDLFSTDPALEQTYFHQVLRRFEDLYGAPPVGDTVLGLIEALDDKAGQIERRNRFLDHLVARFAERFHDYAAITVALSGANPEVLLDVKCRFLDDYPKISGGRGLGYDDLKQPVWDTENVSGVEQRVARLLGMPPARRHNLSAADPPEGMLLIENILLHMANWDTRHLPICGELDCSDCGGDDPYSYRVHVLLPAKARRFWEKMEFRRFVEEVIRQEMPAHVLPRICWVSPETMARVENAYHLWLSARATNAPSRGTRLSTLIDELYKARSVYPTRELHLCAPGNDQEKFQLDRTALGTLKKPPGGDT